MPDLLDLISKYHMTKQEAVAWSLAVLFVKLYTKEFPEYQQFKVSSSRDPRKSELFRHCYRLLRSYPLKQDEFRQYILAQFHILRKIKNGGAHAYVGPNCLSGDKAWTRWLLWKSKFDKVAQVSKASEEPVDIHAVKLAIDYSKKALKVKLPNLCKKDILDALESRALLRWCVLGLVSPYYLVLSPVVQEWLTKNPTILDYFVIDLQAYRIVPEAKEYFKEQFNWEYDEN